MADTSICLSSALEGAPGEIQVIPYGRHSTTQGGFMLDRAAVDSIMRDFQGRRNQMVIDYEHQTLGGGMAPAAGWIRRLIDRGEGGLWAEVEWTPRAIGLLRGCEYRYLSPVFIKRMSDSRVVRLINAALTNQPAIDGMVPVTGGDIHSEGRTSLACMRARETSRGPLLKEKDAGIPFKGAGSLTLISKEKEESMKKVLEALGLEGTGGSDEALEAIGAMRGEMDSLRERLRQSEEAVAAHEAGELVELAMKEGKVTPAQRDWAMEYAARDAEGFRLFVAKAPRVVPLGESAHGSDAAGRAGAHALCPVQAEVNRSLGLSDRMFIKYAKKEEQ